MESRKAINDIKYLIMEHYSDKEPLNDNQKKSKQCFYRYCDQIRKDLERLEKQDKAIEIIKKKRYKLKNYINGEWLEVGLVVMHQQTATTLTGGKVKYPDKEKLLTQDEFNLLKEVFDNGK